MSQNEKQVNKNQEVNCLHRAIEVDRSLYFQGYYCERFGEQVNLEHCKNCEDRVE